MKSVLQVLMKQREDFAYSGVKRTVFEHMYSFTTGILWIMIGTTTFYLFMNPLKQQDLMDKIISFLP